MEAEHCPNRVREPLEEKESRIFGDPIPTWKSKSILDLMSKDELLHQLRQQTDIIVEIERRNARLERILNMALGLKKTFQEELERYRTIYGKLKGGTDGEGPGEM